MTLNQQHGFGRMKTLRIPLGRKIYDRTRLNVSGPVVSITPLAYVVLTADGSRLRVKPANAMLNRGGDLRAANAARRALLAGREPSVKYLLKLAYQRAKARAK